MDNKDETFEEKIKKASDWLGRNLSGIFAVLISLFFLFTGMIQIDQSNLTWQEYTIMTFITIIAGYSITSLVGEYGFTSAKKTKDFIDSKKEYETAVKNGLKYREAIDELAREKALANLRDIRFHLLENVNLWYGDIFDNEGRVKVDFDIYKYKDDKNFIKKLKAYYKAIKLNIRKVNVFSMASSSLFGIAKEETEKEYRTKNTIKSLLIKVLFSIATVGIMFHFLGWNISALIYAFMQVVLWVSMGLIQRQKNFNFTIDSTMQRMIDRTLTIEEFLNKSEEEKDGYIMKAKLRHQTFKELPYLNKEENIL